MGKRRAKSAFEDNPVIDGFLEWMDAPEGQQSIEALDLVFDALEHAGSTRRRQAAQDRLGRRETAIDRAVGGAHPRWASGRGVRCDRNSRAGLAGKLYAGRPTPSANSRNSTGSSNRGSTTMSARHGPPESSRELGTLEGYMRGVLRSVASNANTQMSPCTASAALLSFKFMIRLGPVSNVSQSTLASSWTADQAVAEWSVVRRSGSRWRENVLDLGDEVLDQKARRG